MRIISGRFRGHRLKTPQSQAIRPTSDRLRETLFNVLVHRFECSFDTDTRILDLFAGTGALGLEAMSRGAGFGLFVDIGAEARGLLRENIEALGLTGHTKIYRRDATSLGQCSPMTSFNVIFCDPPYERGLVEPTLQSVVDGGWLAPSVVMVVEERASVQVQVPDALELCDTREAGEGRVLFLRLRG